jgi:hypothetical protein
MPFKVLRQNRKNSCAFNEQFLFRSVIVGLMHFVTDKFIY